ncbi:MAG: stealth family protein [Rhabdochlamydiaceae bacterium]|nr:stealth family protein [Rhabdochlamydiaceae bacterium]
MNYVKYCKRCLYLWILCFTSFLVSQESAFPYPVDIVYLWVDGNDPEWIGCKKHYEQQEHMYIPPAQEACQDNRFWDHEELRYSLRSLIKFAPFFNHIYIITMNQRPKWLLDHPQVTIIDHKEIFKNLGHLPTFNSQALECHLHRVHNLSEHFIYFNDDVFAGKPLSPYDFFTEDGKIKVLFEKGFTVSKDPIVQSSLYRKAWINSNALLDLYFIPENRHRLCHAPFALRKSWIEDIENLFPFVFQENSSHRFRGASNFNVTNGLFQYIWHYQGLAVRGTLTNQMVSLYDDARFEETHKALQNLIDFPKHTFCLQDCMIGESGKSCRLLQTVFETLFPNPAPWENMEIERKVYFLEEEL